MTCSTQCAANCRTQQGGCLLYDLFSRRRFAPLYKVLRAMEDAGRVRRGYFIEGLGSAQFGHAGAVDRLRAARTDDDGPDPEEVTASQIDGETRSQWLHDALGTLSERERKIITRRFLEDDKSTLAEIGDSFGVSKERIRQIEAKALDKLRLELQQHAANPSELLSLNLSH